MLFSFPKPLARISRAIDLDLDRDPEKGTATNRGSSGLDRMQRCALDKIVSGLQSRE